jgi:dihydrofolate reductase
MTSVTLVAAHAHRRVIGLRQRMPWHLPEDLRHFRTLTWGTTVLMGRRTYVSIGKALPSRRNLVLSRGKGFQANDVTVVGSLDDALVRTTEQALFVIGGAQVYALALPLASRAVVTEIDLEVEGDAYFPELDATQWAAFTEHSATAANGLRYRIVDYRRISQIASLACDEATGPFKEN